MYNSCGRKKVCSKNDQACATVELYKGEAYSLILLLLGLPCLHKWLVNAGALLKDK